MGQHLWDESPGVKKAETEAGGEVKQAEQTASNLIKTGEAYVHTPGTTHLNAFKAAVTEAEAEVRKAEVRLNQAKDALKQKLAESGL